MATLSGVSKQSNFVDNNTKFNGNPIKWYVLGHNVVGNKITTLISNTYLCSNIFDAKEPQNPNEKIQSNGNDSYEYSNILQWLNSDKGAGEWYEAQHEYDHAPLTTSDGDTYANDAGFLNGFSKSLLKYMRSIEKMGVSRKVHLPGMYEIARNSTPTSGSDVVCDAGDEYLSLGGSGRELSFTNQLGGAYVRSYVNGSLYKGYCGMIAYNTNSSKWYTFSKKASEKSNTYYVYPVIFVNSDLPVKVIDGVYYLDYELTTEYSDYGSHKGGFDFTYYLSNGEPTENSTIEVYADNLSGSPIKTVQVGTSSYNKNVSVALTDDELSGLSAGTHDIILSATSGDLESTAKFSYEKIAESVPSILTNEIGNVIQPFDTTYQVYDDDGDSIDVVIKLDNSQIDSKTNVEQKTDLTISVGASRFNSLSYGNHTLSIVATDGTNEVTKDIAFKKCSVPSVSIVNPTIGEVVSPFSVQVNYSNADGGGSHVQGVY